MSPRGAARAATPEPPEPLVDATRLRGEPRLWVALLATLAEVPGERAWNLLPMADARVRENYGSLAGMHTLSGWMGLLDLADDRRDPLRQDLSPTAGVTLWAPVTQLRQEEYEVEDGWVRQVYYPPSCLRPGLVGGLKGPRDVRLGAHDGAWAEAWRSMGRDGSPGARYAVSLRYLGSPATDVPEPPEGDAAAVTAEVARLSRECLYWCRSVEVAVGRARARGGQGGEATAPAGDPRPERDGEAPRPRHLPRQAQDVDERPPQGQEGPDRHPDPDAGTTRDDELMRRARDPRSRLTPGETDRATREALRRLAARKGRRRGTGG